METIHIDDGQGEAIAGCTGVTDDNTTGDWDKATCKPCLHKFTNDIQRQIASLKETADAVNTYISKLQTYTG